jgi:hypothetical protein
VVLQSFCPSGSTSSVRKVTVYVSDFGKTQMELEERFGPQGIWKKESSDSNGRTSNGRQKSRGAPADSDDDNEEDDDDDEEEEEDDDDNSESVKEDSSIEDEEDDDDEDEDDDSSDLYENIDGVEEDADEKEEVESDCSDNKGRQHRGKKQGAGDFVRRNGAVGIVMQDDLVRKGKASSSTLLQHSDEGADADNTSGANRSNKKAGENDGFDEVALRKYELSKMR